MNFKPLKHDNLKMTITKKKYDHGIDLQVHPDFSKYPISNVIETMVRNDLHAVSIQGYNNKLILPKILNQLGLKVPHDSAGMRVCLKYAKDILHKKVFIFLQ